MQVGAKDGLLNQGSSFGTFAQTPASFSVRCTASVPENILAGIASGWTSSDGLCERSAVASHESPHRTGDARPELEACRCLLELCLKACLARGLRYLELGGTDDGLDGTAWQASRVFDLLGKPSHSWGSSLASMQVSETCDARGLSNLIAFAGVLEGRICQGLGASRASRDSSSSCSSEKCRAESQDVCGCATSAC